MIKVLYTLFSRLLFALPSSIVDSQKKAAYLNKSDSSVIVTILDPVYGRKATSKSGIYKVILDALKATSPVHP